MNHTDLYVKTFSDSLKDKKIDVVISGSIGAVEAPRLLRALRRLGAKVHPVLTEGGAQFTTPLAVSWAANNPITTEFSGQAPHIAINDACIVTPASANIIADIAGGRTSTPATALIQSYLGQNKAVIVLPNMHESLYDSPLVKANCEKVNQFTRFLAPRREEGKLKFPDPAVLADQISHEINAHNHKRPSTLISMGTTRGYLDDIRYFSNYSSGTLGSVISEEAYRRGFKTNIITGPCYRKPKSFTSLTQIETNQELEQHCLSLATQVDVAICAASVLDFVPTKRITGKIKSSEDLTVSFSRTNKIIEKIRTRAKIKVGFKLEVNSTEETAKKISTDYMEKYNLSLMIVNQKSEVSEVEHKAQLFTRGSDNTAVSIGHFTGKQGVAKAIVDNISKQFEQNSQ
tara:strand:+ start:342 stop:1547 length:1206 start_codon:yes stop_codon:yes gene_type:complete